MTHCTACDRILSDYESTIKNAITFEYMDLCKVCLEDVRPFTKLIERKDLISTQDLDFVDDDNFIDPDTRGYNEDLDDLVEYSRAYSKDYLDN